jgi:hypothetical protein
MNRVCEIPWQVLIPGVSYSVKYDGTLIDSIGDFRSEPLGIAVDTHKIMIAPFNKMNTECITSLQARLDALTQVVASK